MVRSSPVAVLPGRWPNTAAAQALPMVSVLTLLYKSSFSDIPTHRFATAPICARRFDPHSASVANGLGHPPYALATRGVAASGTHGDGVESAHIVTPTPIHFVGPGLAETRERLFDTIRQMRGTTPIPLLVDLPELALGNTDELIEFFRHLAWFCGTTSLPVQLEIVLPDVVAYAVQDAVGPDVVMERCLQWVEWATVVLRELPYGAAAIGRELLTPSVIRYDARQRQLSEQIHCALRYYQTIVAALARVIGENVGRLPHVPRPSRNQEEWDLIVGEMGHRLNNMLTVVALLNLRIGQCVEGQRTDIVRIIRPLLPPRDVVSLWARLATIAREYPCRHPIQFASTALPQGCILLPSGAMSAETQLLVLDEIFTELLRNAIEYARSGVQLEAVHTPTGDLAIRVINDVAQRIDPRALATLGAPGRALSGFRRANSSRMGLYSVVQMAASLTLPRPTFTVEAMTDGTEHFVATVVIPAERFRLEGRR